MRNMEQRIMQTAPTSFDVGVTGDTLTGHYYGVEIKGTGSFPEPTTLVKNQFVVNGVDKSTDMYNLGAWFENGAVIYGYITQIVVPDNLIVIAYKE